MNNRGNTLLSMILTLMIMASMMTLTLKNNVEVDTSHLRFINNYISTKCDALINKTRIELEEDNSIYFNENGHVNMGQTLNIGKHKVIVHLGNGYLSYE